MNFWVHLAIAAVLTAYFVFRYVRDRQVYQLLFIFWVPSTLLSYLPITDPEAFRIFRILLSVFQVIMFVLVLVFMFLPKKRTPGEGGSAAAGDTAAPEEAAPEEAECAPETDAATPDHGLSAGEEPDGAVLLEKEGSL